MLKLTPVVVASLFGAPINRVRAQYLRNAAQLRQMALRAGSGRYRGKTAQQWNAAATDFEHRASL